MISIQGGVLGKDAEVSNVIQKVEAEIHKNFFYEIEFPYSTVRKRKDILPFVYSGRINMEHWDSKTCYSLLQRYRNVGIESFLSQLSGDFSLFLWDKEKETLFLARDRYGVQPLFYTQTERGIFFATELNKLLLYVETLDLSKKGLNLFLSLRYIPAPYTIYKNIFKLEPGYYLKIRNNQIEKKCYVDVKKDYKENRAKLMTSYSAAKEDLRKLLERSVQEELNGTGEKGAFLSGGIDSSIVSALMSKFSDYPVKTFSLGFKEKEYDESDRAKLVARHIGSNHHNYIMDHKDLLAVVDDTLGAFGEPFADPSAIPSMLIAKKASKKVPTILTGDCADELFGGYEKYLAKYYAEQYRKYPKWLRKIFEGGIKLIPSLSFTHVLLRKINKVISSSNKDPEERYLNLVSNGLKQDEKNTLLRPSWTEDVKDLINFHFKQFPGDEMSKTFYSDIKLVLEGSMFPKVNRVCSINNLEPRSPIMSSEMVNLSARLPHSFKIDGTNKKKILKEAFADVLPSKTLNYAKKGFNIPVGIWFKKELKDELLFLVQPEKLKEQGIFKEVYINTLLKEHFSNKTDHGSKLWCLFVFQKWYFNTFYNSK